jgi:DNA polymerase III subunit epsilon
MFWLKRLFGQAPAINQKRWVVLDVETSGLDPRRDHLLAIAAVCIHLNDDQSLKIDIFDSFEAVLKQDSASDKDNILLHGIGAQAQMTGEDPQEVLRNFERWAGDAPLLAFHAAFDESMIQRAYQYQLGHKLKNAWIDVEPLVSASYPEVKARSLDQWMGHLGIECAVRHQAAADTFATAELMLQIWPKLKPLAPTIDLIEKLARESRWLPRN